MALCNTVSDRSRALSHVAPGDGNPPPLLSKKGFAFLTTLLIRVILCYSALTYLALSMPVAWYPEKGGCFSHHNQARRKHFECGKAISKQY